MPLAQGAGTGMAAGNGCGAVSAPGERRLQGGRPVLSPYRVLDLSDERGQLCGEMLGDLGADVVAVEPPGGSPSRRLGPFAKDDPGPEASLFWAAFNRNKRSVTLDLETEAGR